MHGFQPLSTHRLAHHHNPLTRVLMGGTRSVHGGCGAADAELALANLEQFDIVAILGTAGGNVSGEMGMADYLSALADYVRWPGKPAGGDGAGDGRAQGAGGGVEGLKAGVACDLLLFEAAQAIARAGADSAAAGVPRPGMLRFDKAETWRERWPEWAVGQVRGCCLTSLLWRPAETAYWSAALVARSKLIPRFFGLSLSPAAASVPGAPEKAPHSCA